MKPKTALIYSINNRDHLENLLSFRPNHEEKSFKKVIFIHKKYMPWVSLSIKHRLLITKFQFPLEVFSHMTFSLATLAATMIEDKQLHNILYNVVLFRNWGDFKWCYQTKIWIVKTNQCTSVQTWYSFHNIGMSKHWWL